SHKDLIAYIVCNREGIDPIWSCTFESTISLKLHPVEIEASVHGEMKARVKYNELTLGLARLGDEDVESATVNIEITMRKWNGIYPTMHHHF
ncbi:hypothetical protein PFISCL1PPCAC_19452, partial [Pristionchus fissidentatus]